MNSIFTCFPALVHLILVDPSDHHDNQIILAIFGKNWKNLFQKWEDQIKIFLNKTE